MSPWRPYLYLRLLRHLSARAAFLQVSTIRALDGRASSSSLPRHLDDLAYTIYTCLKHPWQRLDCLMRHRGRLLRYLYRDYCRDHDRYRVLDYKGVTSMLQTPPPC